MMPFSLMPTSSMYRELSDARKRLSDVMLGGNVDPIKPLLMGSRKQVVENTQNCLRTAGTNRFVLMSGCGVPPNTPLANVKAMVETPMEYGLGPDV